MRWTTIVALFFLLVSLFFRRRKKPRNERDRLILSSPPVEDLPGTLTALAALGLGVAEPSRVATEMDLVPAVELRLRSRTQECGADFQELVKASGGLLTKADQVTLQVALLDFELSNADTLPVLNDQLESSKGQFYYVREEGDQVVFLTPDQVAALTARGWQFQGPPAVGDTSPSPPSERREPAALLPAPRSSE